VNYFTEAGVLWNFFDIFSSLGVISFSAIDIFDL